MRNDKCAFHVDVAHQSSARIVGQSVRVALEAASPDGGAHVWLSSLGPSRAVWRLFACNGFQWREFGRRYRQELWRRSRPCELLRSLACKRPLTLIYQTGDPQHNVALALKQHLEELECRRRYAAGWIIGGLTSPVREEIQHCGGLWFARHKAWTMPDPSSWRYIQSLLPGDF